MAGNRVSKYSIELEIKADDTRRSIDDIEKSLSNILKSAKDGIGEGLANATKDAGDLAKKIKEIAKNGEQSTAEIEAYGKAASKAIIELEKQSTKLTYSLSEQGKAQKERIADLQKELKTIGETREEKQRAREIEKEIKALQKDVVEGSDEELQIALKQNRTIRATLKLSQREAKLTQAQAKQNKSMMAYFKDDLKALKEKIKLQLEFIKSLKTTEGRYKAIKAAAGKIGKGATKLAKAGLIAGGGMLAIGGVAISHANEQVEREREASRIKGNLPDDQKNELLGDLYIRTGADYTTIVDAINRVQSVLGNINKNDLINASVAEIRMPGAAALFRQDNTGAINSSNFVAYFNRMRSMQRLTGATTEQITSSSNYISNIRQNSFTNATQADLQTLYLALQNSGAFDNDEELQRAFKSFVRVQKDSGESVFSLAQKWRDEGKWERTAYGATNKTQVKNTIKNVDFESIGRESRIRDFTQPETTEAEKMAMKMRTLEELKNKLLSRLVVAISNVLDKIDPADLEKIIDSAFKFFEKVTPLLIEGLSKFVTFLNWIIGKISDDAIDDSSGFGSGITSSPLAMMVQKLGNSTSERGVSGMARANGGLASIPSIAGESGSEMVVPLDFSRSARGRELTQNLTQYFNMSGNETTALSLAQAVKTREFSRAMASNAFLNGRLGR